MICAVASAMPSITPSAVALAPSVTTRKTGSSPWISSEEVSISSDVRPSAHTARGKLRSLALPRAHCPLRLKIVQLSPLLYGLIIGATKAMPERAA